jgi:tetratricopeptide (TPR) repeat protein
MSPYRKDIEEMILEGHSYGTIAREIASREQKGRFPHPEASSIQNHYHKNHMPIGPTVERALIERRSKEIGRSLEEYKESLIDYQAANQIILQKGMARIVRGEITPSMADLQRAIQLQHTFEQATEDSLDSDAWQEALLAYMDVAREFIPQDSMEAYGRALAKHPVLRSMMMGQRQPAALEGEVVSDRVEG